MRSRFEILDEVLCHCSAGADGHELRAVPDCTAPEIKPRSYARPPIERIAVGGNSQREIRVNTTTARGTCPVCGKAGVRVRRAEVLTADRPDLHDLMPGVLIAVRPALAEHKVAGAVCRGSGQVPAETRYRSAQLEKMLADFGPDSVVTR